MALSIATESAIQEMVERLDLHSPYSNPLPVPIEQIARDEGWAVRYLHNLFPLYGFAAVRGNKRLMGINADVARPYQRLAIAHELGHFLNGDLFELHLCNEWDWLYNRVERSASLIAARLLIPDLSLERIETVADLASICDVPDELVQLRLQDWQLSPH